MDRKAIIVVSTSIAFIVLWSLVIVPKFLTKPLPPGAANAVATAQGTLQSTNDVAAPTTSTAPTPSIKAATGTAEPLATPSAPEELLTVATDDARYVFTSHGGGLKEIELLRYPESVTNGRKGQTGEVATLNTKAPVPVMALRGEAALQGDGAFELTRTRDGIRAEKTLPNGLVIVKEFQIASNYLFNATVRIENTSSDAIAVGGQEWTIGTATPMSALDKQAVQTQGVMWYDGEKTHDTPKSWFDNQSFMGCITGPKPPRTEYQGGDGNVVWASVHNQYFAIVAMPATNAPSIVARTVKLPKPSPEELPEGAGPVAAPDGFQTALVYPGLILPAGDSLERTVTFYAGPKEYRTLANIAAKLGNNLDQLMSFGFFGFVSKALLLGMNWLHDSLRFGYGWAIVVITFFIKMVFWPLTAASTRSMKRMQQLQPQMKALQEKYKGDPAKMNRKLMEFMKENKVSPLGGCLPMLLQIPVFFGFFTMIRSAIELRGASFLWVSDLSQPDTLFHAGGFPINLLPLIMGVTMLWQARLTPMSPGMDPAQQKIMKYMPLMFVAFLYNYSAGLTLYWTTQNLLTILQTKLTKTQQTPATPVVSAATPKAALKPAPKKRK